MRFRPQDDPSAYVSLSLTNGNTFGLATVSLADPTVPSPNPLPVTFRGFKADGSQVNLALCTPGNGANSFETYQFDPDFAGGLTNVTIHASGWGMDNLVVTASTNAPPPRKVVVNPVRFGVPTDYPAGSPQSLVVTDFNRDGKDDVAFVNRGLANLLLGRSDGSFTNAFTFSPIGPVTLAAGDFNHDGNMDAVLGNEYDVVSLLGDGAGGFAATNLQFLDSTHPRSIVTGDFDGDGDLDIALVTSSVSIGLGDGNGRFNFLRPTYLSYVGIKDTAAGDVNGDGLTDLVFAVSTTDVCVLISQGNGTFAAPQYYGGPIKDNHDALVMANFNGDSNLDIAVLNRGSMSVTIRLNNGKWFWTAKEYPVGFSPTSITAGDFNGDGETDLVVRSSSVVEVLLGNGDGSFIVDRPVLVASSSGGGGTMAAGDFSGRGLPGIVFVNGGSLSVMLNETTPVLQMTPMGGYNEISWPASLGAAFTLEYTTDLAPGVWRPFPAPPVTIGNLRTVADWVDGAGKFYRLRK
jgi:hypothetical protein